MFQANQNVFKVVLVLVVAAAGSGSPLRAQPHLFSGPPAEATLVGLRFLHPSLEQDNQLTILTGTYDFLVTLPLGLGWQLVGDVPFTKIAIEGQDSSSFGNVHLGLRSPERIASWLTEFSCGIFLPTASRDPTQLLGAALNYHDVVKYLPDTLTLLGTPSWHHRSEGGLVYGIEAGPQILIPVGDAADDLEFLFQYGAVFGLQPEAVSLLAELLGLYLWTPDGLSSQDRFVHSFQVKIAVDSHYIRPVLFFRFPLDDNQQDVLKSSLGIQLEFYLR